MTNKTNQADRAAAMFKRAAAGKGDFAYRHEAEQSVREKTARLRALRLAKEAADKLEPEPAPPPQRNPVRQKAQGGQALLTKETDG
jgi:hypothetical protein